MSPANVPHPDYVMYKQCVTQTNLTLFNSPSIKRKALIGHYRVIHSLYSYFLLLSKQVHTILEHYKLLFSYISQLCSHRGNVEV